MVLTGWFDINWLNVLATARTCGTKPIAEQFFQQLSENSMWIRLNRSMSAIVMSWTAFFPFSILLVCCTTHCHRNIFNVAVLLLFCCHFKYINSNIGSLIVYHIGDSSITLLFSIWVRIRWIDNIVMNANDSIVCFELLLFLLLVQFHVLRVFFESFIIYINHILCAD